MMLLLDVGSSHRGVFEWRFKNKSDIALFRNSKKGDVMTSVKFMLNDCCFYLELTPNGWGDWKEGQCNLWLAVSSLPEGIRAVAITFHLKCPAIGFDKSKSEMLCQPENGAFSCTPNAMDLEAFKNLTEWIFE